MSFCHFSAERLYSLAYITLLTLRKNSRRKKAKKGPLSSENGLSSMYAPNRHRTLDGEVSKTLSTNFIQKVLKI